MVTRAVQVCDVSLLLHSYRCVTDVYRRVTVGYSPQRKVRRTRCYVDLVQFT
jgi:GTP:adenosylcobinamide-phosphate guanylyltransferase